MKKYKHISNEERFFIHTSLRQGCSQADIARALGRSASTICREIKRSMWPRSIIYCYEWALMFKRWRMQSKQRKRVQKITEDIGRLIVELIRNFLSPEQVSSYLKKHYEVSISHETIYQFIYSDPDRKAALKPFLRMGRKSRRKKYGSGARASLIPNRVSIEDRPAIVDQKSRLGDWECDTVIGSDRKTVLVTLVDRRSLFTLSSKVARKTARNVSNAIIRLLTPYKDLVHTLTFDNGVEFIEHGRIAKALNACTFFAHPYSSWERGINENTNGLLRQFFPKGTDFRKISYKAVYEAVDLLNKRPRKTRDYLSPNELFLGEFKPVI